MRPLLLARLSAHAQLMSEHAASESFLSLLQSLQRAKADLDKLREHLDQGRLEDAIPILQQADSRINSDIAVWKRQTQPYKALTVCSKVFQEFRTNLKGIDYFSHSARNYDA